jgi:hypothetical protein
MFHLQYYLEATVIQIQSMQSDMCIYTHIFHSIETPAGQKKSEKIGRSVNAACQGKLSACRFVPPCYRFASPTQKRFRLSAKERKYRTHFLLFTANTTFIGFMILHIVAKQTEACVSSKTISTMAGTTGKTQDLIRQPSVYV